MTTPPKSQRGARPVVDWEAVERDYRTGAFTDRQLGAKHGCSHAAVQKHAKADGWQKDIKGAVKAATQAKLIEAEVSKVASAEVAKRVAKQVANAIPATTEVVAAIAEVNSQVILRHRADLRSARDEALALLAELTWQRDHLPDLEKLAVLVAGDAASPQEATARIKMFSRAVGLGGRVGSVKALAETLAKLIPLEREAFGLREGSNPGDNDPRELSDDELMSEVRGFLGRLGTLPD